MARVLIYAEDPGAALFLKALPGALRTLGAQVQVMAGALAAPYFPGETLIPPPETAGLNEAAATLERLHCDRLVAGTAEDPDTFAFALIEAARLGGIPSFGAVDSVPNARHRFRGRSADPLHFAPDRLLVADDATAAAFAALGYDESRIAVCGHPRMGEIAAIAAQWDEAERQRQRRKWFAQVPQERKILVFVSELSIGLGDRPMRKTADYTLAGTSGDDARSVIVMEEFLLAARHLPDDPYLVLRLHPKQQLQDETGHARLFDQTSQAQPGLEIVHAADLVVGMTSILLVEAAALGRPVLSIVPAAAERAWLGDLGQTIPCVWTREGVCRFVAQPQWPRASLPVQSGPAGHAMAGWIIEQVPQP